MTGKSLAAKVDYLDADVAYLWGLVSGRGEFQDEGDTRRLIVTFPYRLAELPGIRTGAPDRESAIRLGLDEIRTRIQELLESTVEVNRGKHQVTLKAVFTRKTIGWRDLRYLTGNRNHYTEFELPDFAHELDREILLEFMRGFADATSDPNPADHDQAGRHRVVLQVQFGNWRLPIQICSLLQTCLNVPVSHILWGHPNLRSPGASSNWAKETRIRVFAEDFEPVGYYFRYKQQTFQELLRENRGSRSAGGRKCNPKAKRLRRGARKPRHSDECDSRLPPALRGHHFNAYYQICKKIGCKQGKPSPQLEIFGDEDSD